MPPFPLQVTTVSRNFYVHHPVVLIVIMKELNAVKHNERELYILFCFDQIRSTTGQ